MTSVLLLGGFLPGQSLWSIQRGFLDLGCAVHYLPARGVVASHRERDERLAAEEADTIPPAAQWELPYADDDAFAAAVAAEIEAHRPRLLLWWFPKDDRPAGMVEKLRRRFPGCCAVSHTQDDPWDLRRHPEYSAGFEAAVTCCAESVAEYEARGLRAIVLYPPPAVELHGVARAAPGEACDFSLTILSNYTRSGGSDDAYLRSADPVARITHPIPFPDQRLTRPELVAAVADLGRVHVYGGLGFGTFPGVPRAGYRGFRGYAELPAIYRAAKININHHNSPTSRGYLNQRDTAITGSGGFMLTDHVEGIEEIFDVGAEIDTFRDVEELRDKARWWLAHDEARETAARRAQARILNTYGNVAYARRLLEFIGEES